MFDDETATDARPKEETASPEVKLNIADRAVSYGLSRLIDRPNIGDGRRNRRGRRGLDIDIPTGGIPGTREPTGSRLDIDGDGWSDEGTKKPIWVGLPKPELQNPPKINVNKDFYDNNYRFRLSSGSGSKKLKIVSEDNEKAKELFSYFGPGFAKPEKEINLSNEWNPNLSYYEKYDRFKLNQNRFVEYVKSDGNKVLYLLQNTSDAGAVIAYDVDRLIQLLEAKRDPSWPDRQFNMQHLQEPHKWTKAVAGVMHASKEIRTKNKENVRNWEIYSIEVKEMHQRRGLGSAMMKLHRDTFPELRLDHSESLTDEGRAFAEATPIERLASGVKKPSWPRKPTYGAFVDGADEIFGDAKSWEEFRDIYNNREITFLDYETTGLVFDEYRKPSSNGGPVQLGLTKMKNGKVIDKLNLFMNPEEPLGEWSLNNLKDSDGNPLTDNWLSQQMSIAEAHKKAIEFIGKDGILGVQNASFDKDVLEDALDQSGLDWRPGGYIDTKEISDMVLPKWNPESQDGPYAIRDGNKVPSNGLADITKYLGVDLGEKHHYASADAEAAGLVMSAIIDGAIKNEWSPDVLDRNKRMEKMRKNRESFEQKIKQFEIDKQNYLKNVQTEEKLSSGLGTRERPIIKMSTDEALKINAHRNRKYKYGDKSLLHEDKELRRDRNNWLEGLTSEQMSELLVPSSPEEQLMMWMDDFAPGAKNIPQIREAFKKYWDEHMAAHPWDEIDSSPEAVQGMKNVLKFALESNPKMRWAFEKHGAPMYAIWGSNAINAWEARPEIVDLLDRITKQRNYKERTHVAGRVSPFIDLVLFHPRTAIDMVGSQGDKIPMSLGSNHVVTPRDNHIDSSLAGKMLHEWGHWLHFRAIRDYENQTRQSNRSYYGSGSKSDPLYAAGLEISQQYNSAKTNPAMMKLHENGIPIDADQNAPRTITSYAHVSPAEMMAEAITAILHPNSEVAENSLNAKLKKDAEILLGGDGASFRPWEEHSAKEIAIVKKQISSLTRKERKNRLSSGKNDALGREDRKLGTSKADFSLGPVHGPKRGKYEKGRSPKPINLERELRQDWIDIQNSEESAFSFFDEKGDEYVMFTPHRGNHEAAKWSMSVKLADSINFEPAEFFDMFPQYKTDISGKFYVNLQNMPNLEDLITESSLKNGKHKDLKIQELAPAKMSKFYGFSPKLFVNGIGNKPSSYYLEFDSKSEEGQQMLKALVVNEIMGQWGIGTARPISQGLMTAAAELFDVDSKDIPKPSRQISESEKSLMRSVVSSMHDLTQSYFNAKGITHVSLYRGMSIDEKEILEIGENAAGDFIDERLKVGIVSGNPLSSWSTSLSDAMVFENSEAFDGAKRGVLLKQVVPVEDVIGTYLFNFGIRGENEFVVLGKERPTAIARKMRPSGSKEDWSNEIMDFFELGDDEKFYAAVKSAAQKLREQNNSETTAIAEKMDSFVNLQDNSTSRLSSGKRHRAIRIMKNAFGRDVEKFRDTDDSGRRSDKSSIVGPVAIDESIDSGYKPEKSLAREIIEDASKIKNGGPSNNYPHYSISVSKAGGEDWLQQASAAENAKKAVAHMLADATDIDAKTAGSLIFTKNELLDLFSEESKKKIQQAIDSGTETMEDFFGIQKFAYRISQADFEQRMDNLTILSDETFGDMDGINWRDIIDMPKTDEERAAFVNELALLRHLLRLSEDPTAKDEDYKFRIDRRSGLLMTKGQFIRQRALNNLRTIEDKIFSRLGSIPSSQDKSSRFNAPESNEIDFLAEYSIKIIELHPEFEKTLRELQKLRAEGNTGLQPEDIQAHTQIAIERMMHDMFYWRKGTQDKIPQHQKNVLYTLFTKWAGLTDDEMKIIGYYDEDESAFQKISEKLVKTIFLKPNSSFEEIIFTADINAAETFFQAMKNGDSSISKTTGEMTPSFGGVSRTPIRFPTARNSDVLFPSTEFLAPEATFDEIKDISSRSGRWGDVLFGESAINDWEGLLRRRRQSHKNNIIEPIFGQDSDRTNRKLRVIQSETVHGQPVYFFEDASKPSRFDETLESKSSRLKDNAYGKKVSILELPNIDQFGNENAAAAAIDAYLTEEHVRRLIGRASMSTFLGHSNWNERKSQSRDSNEIIDTRKLLKFLSRNEFNAVVESSETVSEELDARSPEGQFALKQRVMREFVRSWAESSNKVLTSALFQQVAKDVFELEDSANLGEIVEDSAYGTFGELVRQIENSGSKFNLSPTQQKAIAETLKSMHEMTQEYFNSKGISHITVYRGLSLPNNQIPEEVFSGDIATVMTSMRPLSSWSTSLEQALNFSGGVGDKESGVVIASVVPIENILSCPLTGFGCLNEDEIVLLGKQMEVKMMPSRAIVRKTINEPSGDNSENFPIPMFSIDEIDTLIKELEIRITKGITKDSMDALAKYRQYKQFLEYVKENTTTLDEDGSIDIDEANKLLDKFDATFSKTSETLKYKFVKDDIERKLRKQLMEDYVFPLRNAEAINEQVFEERLSSGLSIKRKNNEKRNLLPRIGEARRVELKTSRNVERYRNNDSSGNFVNDYFLFDSSDGLSVTVFSGDQMNGYITGGARRFPSSRQIKKMTDSEKPIARLSVAGVSPNKRELNFDLSISDEHMVNGLAETMADFHNRYNAKDVGTKFETRVQRRLASGESSRRITAGNRVPDQRDRRALTIAQINQIEEATKKLSDTGLNLQMFKWKWDGNGKAKPRTWDSPLFVISGRPVVIVEVNGVNIPFYASSGRGGKANVPAGRWYPFFGLSDYDGWFNKTSEEDINDFYGIPEFRSIADILNKTITPSDIPNGFQTRWNEAERARTKKRPPIKLPSSISPGGFINFRNKVRGGDEGGRPDELKDEIREIMHRDLEPVDYLYQVSESGLRSRIKRVLTKVKEGRNSEKAGYRRKTKVVEDVIDDKSFIDSNKDNIKHREVELSFTDSRGNRYEATIASSVENLDLYELPPRRQASVYLRNQDGLIVGRLFAKEGDTEKTRGKFIIADITVNDELQRRGLGRSMMYLGSKYNVNSDQIEHSDMLSPQGARFAAGTPTDRLNSGGSDAKRKEVAKLLSQKDTNEITASLRSIANDYANYRYEMNDDMADSLIRRLRSLNDYSPDGFRLGSGRTLTDEIRIKKNRKNRRLASGRTTELKTQQGPSTLSFGKDKRGVPKVAQTGVLKAKFGDSPKKQRKYFKDKHGINISVKMPKNAVEVEAYYGALQAADDVLENINIRQILGKRKFKISVRNTKFTEKDIDFGDGGEGQQNVPLGQFGVDPKSNDLEMVIFYERIRQRAADISEKLGNNSQLRDRIRFADLGREFTYTINEKFRADEPSRVEEIAKRVAYATTVHEFGHLLDHLARLSLNDKPRKPDKNVYRNEGTAEYVRQLYSATYLSALLEQAEDEPVKQGSQLVRNWWRYAAVSKYGTFSAQEKMAEAFAAWWLFSTVPNGYLLASPHNPRNAGMMGVDEDVSKIAKIVIAPLFDALGMRIKQENTDETSPELIKTTQTPPLVELYSILPFVDIEPLKDNF